MAEIENKFTGPGNKLAKTRRAAGYSREDIADRLHLSVTIIRQMESDEYDSQIPDAFARGYLRNYAKLLEIDPQEIIAKYSQMIGSSMVKNHYEPSQTVAAKEMHAPLGQWVVWLSLVVIVIVATIWFMYTGNEKTEVVVEEQSSSAVIEQALTDQVSASEPENASQLSLTVDDKPENLLNITQEKPAKVAAEPVPTGFQETAEAQLEFYFVGDCWVQVTDANGEVLAVGLKTTGRRFEVSGIAPINVVLGKPRQVDITYNDQSVDLSCFPSSTTARFELSDAQACSGM